MSLRQSGPIMLNLAKHILNYFQEFLLQNFNDTKCRYFHREICSLRAQFGGIRTPYQLTHSQGYLLIAFQTGECDTQSVDVNYMGEPASPQHPGVFYLRTNAKPPYAVSSKFA